MRFEIIISPRAELDLLHLAKNEPKAYAKACRFISELETHPKTGTGHPEPLKGKPENRWSREITKKHRMVFNYDKDTKSHSCRIERYQASSVAVRSW